MPKPKRKPPHKRSLAPIIGKVERMDSLPMGRSRRRTVYPFRDMEVGQAVVIQNVPLNRITAAISSHRRRHPSSNFGHGVDEKTGGIRVWRDK